MTTLGTAELARRVLVIVDSLEKEKGELVATNTTVRTILSWMQYDDLTPDELMDVLRKLQATGFLGRFLNLISNPELREYLKNKGVPWPFILQNWEPSINDIGSFYAGWLLGAAENIYAIERLIVVIVGSAFSEELAKERDKFWDAVRFLLSPEFIGLVWQFAKSPTKYPSAAVEALNVAQAAITAMKEDVVNKLWNLEFREAGRSLGAMMVAVATLVSFLTNLPVALKKIDEIAKKVGELTAARLKKLGVSLSGIRDFALSLRPQLVTPEGFVFANASEDIVVLDRTVQPLGKVSKSKAVQLGSEATVATVTLAKGFSGLTNTAQSWLKEINLLESARRLLTPDVEHIEEVVAAMNKYYRSPGFARVVTSYLRGLSGTSQMDKNVRRGAEFVMKVFASTEAAAVDPLAVTFEPLQTFGGGVLRGPKMTPRVFSRFQDAKYLSTQLEFKSVQDLSEVPFKQLAQEVSNLSEAAKTRAAKYSKSQLQKAGRQLARDILGRTDELDDLSKNLKWVFERDRLNVSEERLVTKLKMVIKEESVFKNWPKPTLDKLDKALDKVINFWPPIGDEPPILKP
jgi:hypothetical protein